MAKAILSYKFKCTDFEDGTYKKREWVLGHIRIVEKIPIPFADLEGWFIDEDKRIAYYYTKDIEDKNELKEYANNIKPLTYELPCYVRYEFSITDFDSKEECEEHLKRDHSEDDGIVSLFSKCLCEEGEIKDCIDEENRVYIGDLNTCIKSNGKHSAIKAIEGPKPV